MKNKYSPYVYIIYNLVNGKKYIGVCVNKNKNKNISYMGSGMALKFAFAKYGKQNFKKKIIRRFRNASAARKYERKMIKRTGAQKNTMYYNIAPGGFGGASFGRNISSKTRNKIANSLKGRKRPEIALILGKPILKYNLQGCFIHEYPSKATAEKSCNIHIGYLKNKVKFAGNFLWLWKHGGIKTKIISYSEYQKKYRIGVSKFVSKLSKRNVNKLFKMRNGGKTYKEISQKFNICQSCVCELLSGKTYKWLKR